MKQVIIGVDLDNTLICYDGVFHAAAVEHGFMPEDGPQDKDGVRQYLCEKDREDDFTLLQGRVYGPDLEKAKPYASSHTVLEDAKRNGATVYLVSHKTAAPYLGPKYDLRHAAMEWLKCHGFYELFTPERIFFEPTLDDKAKRIALLGCTHFIDDMERFLAHPLLPPDLHKLCFRPVTGQSESASLPSAGSWPEIADWLRATV